VTLRVGDIQPLTYQLTDPAGLPVDATVTVELRKPDGTVSTPEPDHPETGRWNLDVPLDKPGQWSAVFTATGPYAESTAFTWTVGPPALPLLAAVDEFKTFMQDQSIDDAVATVVLTMASGAIRDDLEQEITFRAGDELTLPPDGHGVLLLPELPVVAVSAVTLDGSAVVDPAWTRAGVLSGLLGASATVTYDHGHTVVPDGIKAVCMQAAARAFDSPTQLKTENTGPFALSRVALGVQLTDQEKRALDRYRP
jgi:hypothetical protein